MIKSAIAATVSAASLVCTALPAPAVASAPAAHAKRHCAKHSDFRKVHHGQSIDKVARILHNRGRVEVKSSSGGYRDEIRNYKTCSEFSVVTVGFEAKPGGSFHEDAKSGVWVS